MRKFDLDLQSFRSQKIILDVYIYR